MIEADDPGAPELFPVFLHRYDEGANLAPLVMPRRARLDASSVNFYKLELAGCDVWVAVDERKIPPVLHEVCLAPDRPAYLFPRQYRGSADWARVVGLVGNIVKNSGRWANTGG